jgi:protein-serine/threonine kinase
VCVTLTHLCGEVNSQQTKGSLDPSIPRFLHRLLPLTIATSTDDSKPSPTLFATMAYQQQQQQDSRNPNRLHLNFGFNNNQNFAAEQGRAFPTTPSTFPQPFPNSAGQQEVWGTQQGTSGITNQGYFYNNPNPYQQGQQQYGVATPGGAQQGYRSPGGFNDVTNGLAHQFQHQNLGGNSPRSASPYRQPSPAGSRPRTGGQQQQPYGNYLNAGGMSAPPIPQGPLIYDDEAPARNAEKYSTAITERVKLQKMLTQEFFKENVERARARNER